MPAVNSMQCCGPLSSFASIAGIASPFRCLSQSSLYGVALSPVQEEQTCFCHWVSLPERSAPPPEATLAIHCLRAAHASTLHRSCLPGSTVLWTHQQTTPQIAEGPSSELRCLVWRRSEADICISAHD